MVGKQAQVRKPRQGWRPLLLGLTVTLIAVAGSCTPPGSLLSDRGAGDEEGQLSPVSSTTGLPDPDPVSEEAHRYYDEARRMGLRGNWEGAITLYDRAIALEPTYGAAYEGRAGAYHAQGRHEEAVQDYSRAMAIRETSRLYMERGHAYLELGRYVQSDEDYHRVLAVGLPSSSAYIGMGDAHRAMGGLEEAARSYSEAIVLDPESWRAYYLRGVCYFRLRQYQQALEDFERVITLQPHSVGAYFARGAIRWLSGQCTDALEDFEAFVALSDGEEALSQAHEYIEYLRTAAPCEPPSDIPLLF